MNVSRRFFLAGVTTALAAPGRAFAQTAPVTIRVGSAPSEQILPLSYAMRARLFEHAGLHVELTKMASGAAVAAAVAGGAIDIGSSSILNIIVAYAKGLPFTMIAPSGVWLPTSDGGLVVTTSSPLRTAKDFVGKTISAAAVNDINSLAMRAWMDQGGADSSTIKVVEIPQLAASAALQQGRVDGITVSNPAFTLATSDGNARLVANIFSAIAPRFLIVSWFTTKTWVEQNHAAAEAFARVMAQASTYVNAHVSETVGDLADLTGLDRSLIVRMKRTLQVPTLVAGEIQPVIDAAAKYKVLAKPFPAGELVSDAALAP